MKRRYLEGEALLIECRAGAGIIVMVEGETERDDAWFYQQWFGDLAREIRFFPQNGWAKVLTAVRDLREALPRHAIYGIVDRDFTEQAIVDHQFEQCPADGIFRTPYYTLENALLEPAGWLAVVHRFARGAPSGWGTEDEVAAHLAEAYRRCLPVAAFNRVVHEEHRRTSHSRTLEYLHHPNAAKDAAERLRRWGRERECVHDLGDAFEQTLMALDTMQPEAYAARVTGKAVLIALCDRLNAALPRGGIPTEYLKDAYLREHPTPPADLVRLIETIRRYASG